MSVAVLERSQQQSKNVELKAIIKDMLKAIKPFTTKISKDSTKFKFKSSFLQSSQVALLMSFASSAIGEFSVLMDTYQLANPSKQIQKQSNKKDNTKSSKIFEYKNTFINPQISHQDSFSKGKNHFPTYEEERYAKANKNLDVLNQEFNEIIRKNKLVSNGDKNRFVETVISIKLENQVKTILNKNSNADDIAKAQKTYLAYVGLLNKDAINNLSNDLKDFFDTLSNIIEPDSVNPEIAVTNCIEQTSNIINKSISAKANAAKEIENAMPKIYHDNLKRIGDQIDKGTYIPSEKKPSLTIIAEIPPAMKCIKNNLVLIEGSQSIGFAHIAKRHILPKVVKENDVVIESTGVTDPRHKPGTEILFPIDLKSEDIVNIMIKALSLKDSNVKMLKNKMTGKVDIIDITSIFSEEVSGIKSVRIGAMFDETTNNFEICSFYPTTGSKVRKFNTKD